jgi:hypothetical protein
MTLSSFPELRMFTPRNNWIQGGEFHLRLGVKHGYSYTLCPFLHKYEPVSITAP